MPQVHDETMEKCQFSVFFNAAFRLFSTCDNTNFTFFPPLFRLAAAASRQKADLQCTWNWKFRKLAFIRLAAVACRNNGKKLVKNQHRRRSRLSRPSAAAVFTKNVENKVGKKVPCEEKLTKIILQNRTAAAAGRKHQQIGGDSRKRTIIACRVCWHVNTHPPHLGPFPTECVNKLALKAPGDANKNSGESLDGLEKF